MSNRQPPRRPCLHFRRGKCMFGAQCKFSHDSTSVSQEGDQHTSQPTAASIQRPNTRGRKEDDLREWKRILRQGRQSPSRVTCDRFFELAARLVDGDPGGLQEAVRLLADEDGLAYIRLLAETHIPNTTGDHAKRHLWVKQLRPLFTVVTHHRVADSAVLEQQVATMYNFMQGIGSRRMKLLFDFAITLINSAPIIDQSTTTGSVESKLAIIEICLAVLSKMIDCNTSNIVDETFKRIVQQINFILKTLEERSDDYMMLQSQKWITYINRRIGVGDDLLLSLEARTSQDIGQRAEFILPKNLPGSLSPSGPRHDNDHVDIANISILPTRGEIVSSRGEYLPSNDSSSFHRPGIVGRLDREFRLLREDTIGQLRDGVRDMLEEIEGRQQSQRRERQILRTYTYPDAEICDASFERLHGLDLLVRFRQPVTITSLQRRRDWWAQSKRLQSGALVCLISRDGSVLFCIVAEATIITTDDKVRWNQNANAAKQTSKEPRPSLAEDDAHAYMHLNLADLRDDNFERALRWYKNVGPRQQLYLVEFPGVLLASFQHTLEALQRISKTTNVPFIDLIAPVTQRAGSVEVPPPQYSTKPGFYYDLSCLTKDGTPLRHSPTQHLDPRILMEKSTLDETQSSALLNSLSRGLALIQGPPGTGKSYTGEKIIKVLLASKRMGAIGPILCVCYTNHALDQLLEHLLDDGVKQIIRIGSRSKSDRLEKVNLRCVTMGADRTKAEKSSLWNTRDALTKHESAASAGLRGLQRCLGQPALQAYLEQHFPLHHQALFGTLLDEEGFQEARKRPKQVFEQWLSAGKTPGAAAGSREVEQLKAADLWTMNYSERHRLYHYWQTQIRDPIIQDLLFDHRTYIETTKQRSNVLQEVDLRCLSAADVVGVTTTGLAKNLDLLSRLRCKVLICEEAGEVLEAHNLTALLPSIEHCILIGDQLQLRPQIQNYDLNSTNPRGAQYSLDVSLFERLVEPPRDNDQRLPFSRLDTQRRMHPAISDLIRHTLYSSLVDGGTVTDYPEVLGMRKRLFWLQHTMLEDRAQHQDHISTSHTNSFEVDMTVALVQHLVRQGTYAPDDIAVITPYLGQLFRLRRAMQSLFEISVGERDLEELSALEADQIAREDGLLDRGPKAVIRTTLLKSVRLATVDNFQGEEAKVIVISLVRSNNQRRCGFLNTPNRINVLLSRAQHGMYLIGNTNTYEHVPMWAKVITMLRNGDNIGPSLQLQCPRHPDHPIEVSTPDHILQFSPEGGCQRQCDRRLSCGHACVNRCHSEILHSAVRCLEPCPRTKKGCDHPCRRVCGDACEPKCMEKLKNLDITLACGHKKTTALCWQAQDNSSIVCKEATTKIVPGCNHRVVVPCHIDVTATSYKCTSRCGDAQPCGHSCRSECHLCKDRKDGAIEGEHHETCRQPCGRAYTACRHACQKPCHGQENCPPCPNPCDVRCSHSKCSKQCHEPCAPCAEQSCSSACPHQKCTMPCAAPCNWVPCSRRCEELLSCGHRCPSLCGEACPSKKYCQVCCDEDIKSTIVDWIMGMQYHEVNLDEDPCIFPDCGHFLTKANMDGVMDLKSHYEMSAEDSPSPMALASSSMPFSMKEVKTCPSCRGSLRNISRYGRIIRRATLDEATKKFIAWSQSEYLKLADEFVNIQMDLEKARAPAAQEHITRPSKRSFAKGRLQQLHQVRDWVGNSRYDNALRCWARISGFVSKVRKEEQPLQRVADFVRHATREQKTTGEFAFDENLLQVKGVLQATALVLKCEIAIFSDFMTIRSPLVALRPAMKIDLAAHMRACEDLISMATSARLPREQVEGHVYFAQFCAFARALALEPSEEHSTAAEGSSEIRAELADQGKAHVAAARELLARYVSARILEAEVDAAEKMLRDAVFYTDVSAAELRAVYRAMAGEFSGTGHWYTCANNHPFTVGECGMPMEQARCPECGAPVGGTNHQAVHGVRHASEIENLARDMNRLDM